MSCGRAYTDHLQNEKVLLLSTWTRLRLLNNPFSLIIQPARLRKIKAQLENIILSICRSTGKLHSVIRYIKLHIKSKINICYYVILLLSCGP